MLLMVTYLTRLTIQILLSSVCISEPISGIFGHIAINETSQSSLSPLFGMTQDTQITWQFSRRASSSISGGISGGSFGSCVMVMLDCLTLRLTRRRPRNVWFENPPEPPLGLNRLLGGLRLSAIILRNA